MKQIFCILLSSFVIFWAANFATSDEDAIKFLTPDLLKSVVGADKVDKYELKVVKTENPYENLPTSNPNEPQITMQGASTFYLYFNAVPRSSFESLGTIANCKARLSRVMVPGAVWKIREQPKCS